MASWGRPISMVFSGTWVLEMFPSVEPPAISERLAKVCTGTPASRQRSRNMAVEMPSVQYFWLALYLITMPSPRYGRLDGSALSG